MELKGMLVQEGEAEQAKGKMDERVEAMNEILKDLDVLNQDIMSKLVCHTPLSVPTLPPL